MALLISNGGNGEQISIEDEYKGQNVEFDEYDGRTVGNDRKVRNKYDFYQAFNVHRRIEGVEYVYTSTNSQGDLLLRLGRTYESESEASSSSATASLRIEPFSLQNSGRSSPALDGRGRKLSLLSPRRCLGASPAAAAVMAIIPYTGGGAVSFLVNSAALRSEDGARGVSAVVIGTLGRGRDGKSRPRSLGCRPIIVSLTGLLLLLSFSDLGNALYTRGGVLAPRTVKGNRARAVY